ncbi:MAG: type II toxin-antitoxin system VapC family toxin [Prevotella sp.]|nr:type II toxin-antitoxin system VapC family toxin [Prevotella sp.]
MRLYLDTNILINLLTKQKYNIDRDTWEMLMDCSNLLYTSTVCVHEFIHLRLIGKVRVGKDWKNVDVVQRITDFGIEILPIKPNHLKTEETLPLFQDHRDPNDRLIIAQAITDKATLVSSDLKFPKYCKLGLSFHQNIR